MRKFFFFGDVSSVFQELSPYPEVDAVEETFNAFEVLERPPILSGVEEVWRDVENAAVFVAGSSVLLGVGNELREQFGAAQHREFFERLSVEEDRAIASAVDKQKRTTYRKYAFWQVNCPLRGALGRERRGQNAGKVYPR